MEHTDGLKELRLPFGKIPVEILENVVFKHLGVERKELIVGPSLGVDGAVIDVGNHSIIVATDPVTGAIERIGWLAVNINMNDVATFGVEPAVFFSCVLLHENADRKIVETICAQMDKAAKELGIAIAGGHCEVTPGLVNPLVIGCAMGTTEKGNYVTAAGAKPKDQLVLTKSSGIEGTAILASDREEQLRKAVGTSILEKARGLYNQISVVKEALLVFNTGRVDAMHDPTEGGIAGGIHEMADASNVGVKIFEEKIPIAEETLVISRFFEIDPLQLTSSGALLVATKAGCADEILKRLREHRIQASLIGEFIQPSNTRLLVRSNGEETGLIRPKCDHLWQALQRKLK